MEQRDSIKKFWAGTFFVFCIVLIAGSIFVIGVERGFMERKFTMTVLFREVGGLVEGAPVRLSGVTVGTVATIDFLNEEVAGRNVRVRLNIFSKFEKQLHKSSDFTIITEGVLGEKVVEIRTASDFSRPDLRQPIIGEDPLDMKGMADKVGSTAQSLQETSQAVTRLAGDLQDVSGVLRRLLMRIEEKVIEGDLFKVF
jgi:ABC-type transporter Mla subunit MlaD